MRSDHPAPAAWRRTARAVALATVLAAALATGGPAPAPAQDGPEGSVDVEALRRQYEDLAGAEAQTLVDYDLATRRLADLLPRLQAARAAQDEADRALVTAEGALAVSREDEEAAAAALAAARRQVAAAEDRLRGHAVDAYMSEGGAVALTSALDLLEGDDGALVRRGYRESISERQQRLVDQLVAARDRADAAAGRATATRQAAQRRRDDVERLRAASAAALAEATRLTREAADERARQDLLLTDIRSQKVAIEARIVSLDKAADGIAQLLAAHQADDPDWVPGAVDVASPSPGSPIVSEYGQRAHPILNVTRLHAGCDIDAPAGSPVRAAADGVVLLAEERGGYGLTVVVAHGSSLGTVYAHNSSLSVAVGDVVEQGDELAKVGSTGLSTGPHIHFETRIKGVPVNPRNFLPPDEAAGTGPGG